MKIIRWLAAAFSMYSKIPVPAFDFREDDLSRSLIFFPLVGAVIGAAVFVINCAAPFAALPAAVRILLTLLAPLAITGGFHADGLMDTADAMNSYASKERKLEILKDPHIGAFAVISLIKWLLLYAAAVTVILQSEAGGDRVTAVLGLTFVISRCLSGLTSFLFRKARRSGMLYEETAKGRNGTVICLLVQLLAACAAAVLLNMICGVAVIAAFALFTFYYKHKAYREFGGVTGDTAGYFLTAGEITAAVFLAAAVCFL